MSSHTLNQKNNNLSPSSKHVMRMENARNLKRVSAIFNTSINKRRQEEQQRMMWQRKYIHSKVILKKFDSILIYYPN